MPQVSPLDRLYARRQILAGDHLAGRRFGFLERRRLGRYAAEYEAAFAALEKAGGDALTMVQAIVLEGRMPANDRELSHALNGLDALNTHFRKDGPPAICRVAPGCRPMRYLVRVAAAA